MDVQSGHGSVRMKPRIQKKGADKKELESFLTFLKGTNLKTSVEDEH